MGLFKTKLLILGLLIFYNQPLLHSWGGGFLWMLQTILNIPILILIIFFIKEQNI